MPEALATSKRKFYKLLDNLTTPSPSSSRPTSTISLQSPDPRASVISTTSTSTSTAPLSFEPTAKRLRPSTSSTTISSLRALHARNASLESVNSIESSTGVGALRDGGRVQYKPSIRATRPVTTSKNAVVESAAGTGSKEMPHFSPWSHETFLRRLKTFAPVTLWHPKPEGVSEVQWAKRGWECVDSNTVGCKGGCGRRVVVKLDPRVRRSLDAEENGYTEQDAEEAETAEDEEDLDEQFERGLVEKYKALIVDGHAESCLWRKTGCKDDIYRLPVVRTAVWQPELRDRYNSLLELKDSITDLQIKAQPDMDPSPEKLLADLPSSLLAKPTRSQDTETHQGPEAARPNPQPSPTLCALALRIALTGWHGTTESRTALLSCPACFQRIGLWMYQPDYHNSTTKSTTTSLSDDDDDNAAQSNALDLVEMHREHCPWRYGASQCGLGEYAGWPAWRVLWRVVGRYADEQRRRGRSLRLEETAAVQREGTDAGHVAGDGEGTNGDDEGTVDDLADTASVMSREEIQKMDRERTTKLRKLKRMFTMKKKAPIAPA